MILKRKLAIAAALVGLTSAAQAQACAKNFRTEGVPLLTPIEYKAFDVFPNVPPKKAIENLPGALLAEGYSGVNVDRSVGLVTAEQDGAGSGNLQTIRLVVRPSGKGSRIDGIFRIQIGQIAAEAAVRDGLCRLIASAKG